MNTRPFQAPLSLSNDGALSLFFVGVGSAFSKVNYQTNILIIKGREHLLIDCGTRCGYAFTELGSNLADIDTMLITHSHADHIGGLEEALLMARYVRKRKISLILPVPYRRTLWNYSLKGGVAFNERHNGKELRFSDVARLLTPKPMDMLGRQAYHYRFGSIDLKLLRTMHIPDNAESWKDSFWSTAVVIDDRIFFSGDTRFDPKLVEEVETTFEPEIIFHDCQFFTGGVHAGIDELAILPAAVKKKMLLVHYGDDWEKQTTRVRELGFAGLTRQWLFYDFPEKKH
ncbi:MBL fold metallo-hydrolase [Sediminispirochaeta bajacaliforniensis]|uniref:MBL fold metallo-hydrolase n=1 Tax=Sediminispirochaeta bajacaliforniensis TaxID=148 RepID=UPI00037FD0D3|nr:MBL fold metallo-hydrolase [Sediminispirochaeta bajacaliforniensis]